MRARPNGVRMARRTDSSDDDEEELETDEEEEEAPPRRSTKRAARKPPSKGRPRPIRRWSTEGGADPERAASEDEEGDGPRPRVFWRARDSLYFAPLVALAVVILLVVSLFAYTQNWPPVYVVESESMQHGSSDVLGVINTGDLVLAQRVSNSTIQPYVVAQQSGYSTYGEFGDVLLYAPNGAAGTPIIHRAIIYLQWVPGGAGGYTAYGLNPSSCGIGSSSLYATPATKNGCLTSDLAVGTTIDLFHVGWADVNLSIALQPGLLGQHSGYLTMGDNNFEEGQGTYDQSPGFQLSQLVEPGWVIGVARGMIPWVGALKLWIEGSSTAGEVPPQSWQFLGLTFAGIILLAFGLHYALRVEGIEDPRRKAEEEEEAAEDPPDGSASRARHFLRSLRPWGAAEEDEEGEEEASRPAPNPRHVRPKSPPAAKPRVHRGRPPPKVRRPGKSKRSAPDDEED
jgi:signal peptidase